MATAKKWLLKSADRRKALQRPLKPKLKKREYKHPDIVIYSRNPSTAARALSRAIGCRRVMGPVPGFPFAPTVVNWGAGPGINPNAAVHKAINKLETLKCLEEAKVPCLKFTTDKEEVRKWLKKGSSVIVRATLTGSGGAGIHILKADPALLGRKDLPVQDAPLYTRNYPKTHEFRVHVFDGRVIDFVEKKARVDHVHNGAAVHDRLVRNHSNGWVFAHDNLSPSVQARAEIERISVAAVRAVGLLFGAVDILAILTPSAGGGRGLKSAVVCEINTAPGLECTQTIAAYAQAVIRKHNNLRGIA